MKPWKQEIVDEIVRLANGCRMISLKDVAEKFGCRHIKQQDVLDIRTAVLKVLPGFRAVRLMRTKNDSLFQSLAFIDKEITFQTEAEFLAEAESDFSYEIVYFSGPYWADNRAGYPCELPDGFRDCESIFVSATSPDEAKETARELVKLYYAELGYRVTPTRSGALDVEIPGAEIGVELYGFDVA